MAPPTKMLRMTLKLQIRESNRKDVFDPLILNEKTSLSSWRDKIWLHNVIYRYTPEMKNWINNVPSFVEGRWTPHFFRYQLDIRFEQQIFKFTHILYRNKPKMSILTSCDVNVRTSNFQKILRNNILDHIVFRDKIWGQTDAREGNDRWSKCGPKNGLWRHSDVMMTSVWIFLSFPESLYHVWCLYSFWPQPIVFADSKRGGALCPPPTLKISKKAHVR